MIVCRKCSRRHPDGTTFCTCGAFLEFDGEQVADLAESGSTQAGADHPGSLPPPIEAQSDAWASNPPEPRTAPAGESAPWSGLPSDVSATSAHSGVEARHPDAPLTVPDTEPVRVDSTARPTDLSCRTCGTPNPAEREFCRHCGQSLHVVTGVVSGMTAERPVPWWRRFGRGARRRAAAVDPMSASATVRHLSRGGLTTRTMAFRTTGITVVLLGALAFLGPWRGTVIAKAKDLVGASRYHVVDNVTARTLPASPSIDPLEFDLQPAELAVDDYENTAWATRWLEPTRLGLSALPADNACSAEVGTDAVLQFGFEDPTDISRVRILGGRFAGDDARAAFSRPHIVELRAGDECSHVELPDDGTLTTFDFERDDVTEVELRILGRYAEDESAPTVEVSAVVFERKR